MIKLIRSAIGDLRRQPVLGAVSVIGTALAIYLIMMVVMLQSVKVEPFAPESNRDRFLHATYLSITTPNGMWNACHSYPFVRNYMYPLTTPEAVTAYSINSTAGPASVPGAGKATSAEIRTTDHNYWKVFDFTFLSGAPYSEADVNAGLPKAVISESVARRLFGTIDAVGRELMVNYRSHQVAGVVADVSPLATKAFAEVWIPITSIPGWDYNQFTNNLSVTLLAPDPASKEKVRAEFAERMKNIDPDHTVTLLNRPYDQYTETCEELWANCEPDVQTARRNELLVYLVLLLVPAINLAEMTRSRMRRRYSEIGLRRAFGATRGSIMRTIFAENFIVTLFAGIIGLALAFATALIFGANLIASTDWTGVAPAMTISPAALQHWSTFGKALLFCFILNLLCSGLPAWRASRINIVNAITGQIHKS
ncbi:MAG: ABC transporter permease [Muribaculaceae bacterium]|nr:ABC transporter permease [Muribaculaceae bacterium]